MKYGSVCSGIEAASVAWESLGWQAQWYSEIEHFPSAVLAHRFPTVPNLGDMTKLQENEIFNGNSIDLLVGGTPCTSFSVAGLRKGLDDPRGQLMLTFCELAARKRPRWVVWENVPGVLSSNKGEDLASFLGLLTGREIHPPIGGWKNSGVVEGIGSAYGVAWTVLDAQYFGVAQRRRRIFAVGYLGDWRPAAAVLFESYRLSGDIKEGRKKRKATSADAQGSVGGGGIPRVSGSLDTECGGGKLTHQSVNNGHLVPAWRNGEQTAATLTKQNANGAQRMPDKDNFGAVLEPKAHAFKVRGGSETETGEQGGTLGKKAGKGYLGQDEKAFTIGTTQDQQIAQPIAIQGNLIGRDAGGPQGIGVSEDGIMYTQTKADVHGVAQPIAYSFDSLASNSMKSSNPISGCNQVEVAKTIDTTTQDPSKNQGGIGIAQPIVYENHPADSRVKEMGETCQTVSARFGTGGGNVPLVQQPVAAFIPKNGAKASGIGYAEEQSPTLDTGCSSLGVVQPVAVDLYNQTINATTHHTLRSDASHNEYGAVMQPIAVDTYNQTINEKTSQTIGSSASDVNHYGAVLTPIAVDTYNQTTSNVNQTIKSPQGGLNESIGVVLQPTMAIRRLLPTECEILQGFPRNWTLIPYRNKPAEQCPDGPRYKACGNSMAVPVMAWIGKRIQMVEDIINNKAI